MTILVIQAQDINTMHLGLLEEEELRLIDAGAQPEGYLKEIDAALHEWGLSIDAIDALAVVTGPGSFTAARVSSTIANGLLFSRNIPLIELVNSDNKPLRELVPDILSKTPERKRVQPYYDRPPHITESKK